MVVQEALAKREARVWAHVRGVCVWGGAAIGEGEGGGRRWPDGSLGVAGWGRKARGELGEAGRQRLRDGTGQGWGMGESKCGVVVPRGGEGVG